MNPNNTGVVKGDNIFGVSDMRSQRTGSSAMISDNIARMAPENGLESFVRDRPPQKIIEDADLIQCYKSQLSINCPYASNEFASRFCVCSPRRSPKGDYILYAVLGEDSAGPFELQRRFSEFNLLQHQLGNQRHLVLQQDHHHLAFHQIGAVLLF